MQMKHKYQNKILIKSDAIERKSSTDIVKFRDNRIMNITKWKAEFDQFEEKGKNIPGESCSSSISHSQKQSLKICRKMSRSILEASPQKQAQNSPYEMTKGKRT